MKITAQAFIQNPKFINLLESMEKPILQATSNIFKLNNEERDSLSKELKPMVKGINSGKLKPKELPKDLLELLGSNKASQKKLMEAANTFVESLNLKRTESSSSKINKKQLRNAIKEAVEKLEFDQRMAAKIGEQAEEQWQIGVIPSEEDCINECNEIYKVAVIGITLKLILTFIPCFILGWLTFLIGRGLCWVTSLLEYIWDMLEASGEYIACRRRCEGNRLPFQG